MSRTRLEIGRREDLRGDCANCVGLCCVALAFSKSADFPFDKPAGDPCINLDQDDGCRIHDELRPRGFKGCAGFDCFGAGQKVSKHAFSGRSWRDDPAVRTSMFTVFPIVRSLCELLWYLDRALSLPGIDSIHDDLRAHFERVQLITDSAPTRLSDTDVDREYEAARPLLIAASAAARSATSSETGAATRLIGRPIGPGADLVGADLADSDLRGVELRGCLLIGANLTGADLRWCDVLGADLRDANIRGARLDTAIYLTQMQVNSANGDSATILPPGFQRPKHWSGDDF